MKFSERYLSKSLAEGTLRRDDLLAFSSGDEVREKFAAIEKEAKVLAAPVVALANPCIYNAAKDESVTERIGRRSEPTTPIPVEARRDSA